MGVVRLQWVALMGHGTKNVENHCSNTERNPRAFNCKFWFCHIAAVNFTVFAAADISICDERIQLMKTHATCRVQFPTNQWLDIFWLVQHFVFNLMFMDCSQQSLSGNCDLLFLFLSANKVAILESAIYQPTLSLYQACSASFAGIPLQSRPLCSSNPTLFDIHLKKPDACAVGRKAWRLPAFQASWVAEPVSSAGHKPKNCRKFVFWIVNCDVTSIEIWHHKRLSEIYAKFFKPKVPYAYVWQRTKLSGKLSHFFTFFRLCNIKFVVKQSFRNYEAHLFEVDAIVLVRIALNDATFITRTS